MSDEKPKRFKSTPNHEKSVRIRLTKREREMIENYAIANSQSMSEFIRDLIKYHLEKSKQ